jgi:hypothetical protein
MLDTLQEYDPDGVVLHGMANQQSVERDFVAWHMCTTNA